MHYPYVALALISFAASSAPEVSEDGVSFFDDLALTHGFRLSALRSSLSPVEVGSILVSDASETPRWRLAQWGSRFSLESVCVTLSDDGTRLVENEGKRVKVLPGGLGGKGVLLEVFGGREYNGALRQQGEAWPHLLIEQKLTPQQLHKLMALNFSVEFRVEKCDVATDKPLDPGLHTAHITAFWTIHNTNPDSQDHNDMIWFGLPLYDARYPIPRGHQALDAGQEDATGKFICTIEGDRFYDTPVAVGEWHTLSCDLLPLLREALESAHNRGFLTHTRLEDLIATSFNLGWEVPGPYDCAIFIRALQLCGVDSGS